MSLDCDCVKCFKFNLLRKCCKKARRLEFTIAKEPYSLSCEDDDKLINEIKNTIDLDRTLTELPKRVCSSCTPPKFIDVRINDKHGCCLFDFRTSKIECYRDDDDLIIFICYENSNHELLRFKTNIDHFDIESMYDFKNEYALCFVIPRVLSPIDKIDFLESKFNVYKF